MPIAETRGPGGGPRHDAILTTAVDVFLRYGYRKTSMDDLARAAGLSRQGLYLHFAAKDALFRASIGLLTAQRLEAVRAALARDRGSIEDRLLDAFVGLDSHGDDGSMSRELLGELMATAAQIAGPVVDAFDETLLDDLTRALRTSGVVSAWKPLGIAAKELSRHLLVASRGIERSARSAADYRDQMRVAVRLVCRGHDGTTAAR